MHTDTRDLIHRTLSVVVGRRQATHGTLAATRRYEVARRGKGQLVERGLARQSLQVVRHSRHALEGGVHGLRLELRQHLR